jgi:hypothetical protein
VEVTWDNALGAGDQLWNNVANWTNTGTDKVPEAADYAILDLYANDGNGPIIGTGTNAVCSWLGMGYRAKPPVEAVLTMTGGTLTVVVYGFDLGYSYGGNYRFDLSGGDVNVAADLTVANGNFGTTGVVNMTGGTIAVGEDIELGSYDTAQGLFNISAGSIDVTATNDSQIYIGFYSPNPSTFNITGGTVNAFQLHIGNTWGDLPNGSGHLKLHGGTINAGDFRMGGGGSSSVDVTSGVLIVDTDVTVPNGYLFNPGVDSHADVGLWTGTVPILVAKGLITAYDVNSGVIITDDVNYPAQAGLRAVVNVDYGVTNAGKTTITAAAVDPNLAWNPTPANGSGGLIPSAVTQISWSAGDNAASHNVYFGTSFAEVNDADTSSGEFKGNQSLADVNYPVSVTWGRSYYWRIDEVGASQVWEGAVWSFATTPARATWPSPQDGADGVSPSVVLSWIPGAEADTHKVYFSADYNDVNDRFVTPATPEANSYNPGALEFSTTYYWAVDEVNLAADVNVWPGEVWSFTTTDHLVVDDFDSYNNNAELYAVWDDYWVNGSGAQIFIEGTVIYTADGNSIRYSYNNTTKSGGKYVGSRINADVVDLPIGQDWTASGIKVLKLYFYGDALNAPTSNDKMYVALYDGSKTGVVKYAGDMNDIKEAKWHEWNIKLQDFAGLGVVLSSIDRVYIGFGGNAWTGQTAIGSKGKVYFDDIEVWPPYCRPELVTADITGDCTTDIDDLEILAADWLVHDYNFIAAEPCEANLIGQWKFDEGSGTVTVDSSIYGNDGNIIEAVWTTGHPGDPCNSALKFAGDGIITHDLVRCAERTGSEPGTYPAELMPDTFTISCWTKLDRFVWFSTFVTNGIDSGDDECGFFLYNWGWEGESGKDFGLAIRTETGTEMTYVETPNIYESGTWYHLAATYDGQYVNIYVDGLLSTGPVDVGGPIRWVSNSSSNYPGNFVIGSWEDVDYSLHVNGTIDEVRYYNYPLSGGEISVLAGLVAPGQNVYQPVPSPANITDPEPILSRKVNFYDYAIMADNWLVGPVLWPSP